MERKGHTHSTGAARANASPMALILRFSAVPDTIAQTVTEENKPTETVIEALQPAPTPPPAPPAVLSPASISLLEEVRREIDIARQVFRPTPASLSNVLNDAWSIAQGYAANEEHLLPRMPAFVRGIVVNAREIERRKAEG